MGIELSISLVGKADWLLLSLIMNSPISESDKRLVEQLFDEYHLLMLYVANQLLDDHTLAEDAVSESLIKIIRHRDKLRDVSSHQTKGYIVKVVRSTSINFIKQRVLQSHEPEHLLENVPVERSNIIDDLVMQERADTIIKVIKSLPGALKDVAYLYLVQELNHDEIGRMLGISVSASKKRLSRSRRAIGKNLKKICHPNPPPTVICKEPKIR